MVRYVNVATLIHLYTVVGIYFIYDLLLASSLLHSPCIAPCGHAFCLPCVLGYLVSVSTELNKESERINKNKQQNVTNSSRIVGCSTLAGKASVTSIRARCPMCSSGSSMVLKAGESIITYKDLRPVLFVPVLAIAAAEETNTIKGKKLFTFHPGTRMTFVKLHRAKECSAPYLPLTGHIARGGTSISASLPEQPLPDLPDGDDDRDECTFTRQYFVGLNEYENILQRDLDDLKNYKESAICKMDTREDWNVAMSIEAVQASQRRWMGSTGDDEGFRGMELEAKITNQMNQMVLTGTSADLDEEAKPQASPKKSALLQPGSFYLRKHEDLSSTNAAQGDATEFLYYQSADGQPCFLSGINVAGLMHEFSLYKCEEDGDINADVATDNIDQDETSSTHYQQQHTSNIQRNTQPLPDELTATVVAMEELVVTHSLIKRKHFLSHLTLGSTVSFAEIDWYSGGDGGNRPMLSHNTLAKFKGELQRRKSERQRTAKAEKNADNIARVKAEKNELRRRRELLGADYVERGILQTIDPDDVFFQAPAASFDESEVPSSPTFRFNEVCATGGVWPELASSLQSSGHQEGAGIWPELTSGHQDTAPVASSPPKIGTSWGSQKPRSAIPKPKAVDSFPSLSEASQKPSKNR